MGKFAEYTLLDIVTCTEYYIKKLTNTYRYSYKLVLE